MSAVAGVTALVGAVKSLTNAFKGALDNYSHFEKMEMGLTTFFQDAEKGKKQFEEIRKLSNETTFGVDELADSFTQLANVGINTNTIKDKLVMLGNVAGGDKAKFADLVSIYAKINSTGKAGQMQIQQLAMRGIPIYDVLKKIGVQGTATAEDITKAFEEMTKEGGQFHDAMQNINSTIEGKRGFISDYMKEMSVNFAEVTGLADAYKKVLDVLADAIAVVSDKLLEWSKNPVASAIIKGVAVTAVGAIGTVIVTSIIPALGSVIASMKIITVLQAAISANPVGLAFGLSAVAVLGLITGMKALAKNTDEATESTKKLEEAIIKAKEAQAMDYNLMSVGKTPESGTREQKYQDAKKWQGIVDSQLAEAEKRLSDASGLIVDLATVYQNSPNLTIEDLHNDQEYIQAKKTYDIAAAGVQRIKKAQKDANAEVEKYEEAWKRVNGFQELGDAFTEIQENSVSKAQKNLDEITAKLDKVNEYEEMYKNTFSNGGVNYIQDNEGNLIKYDETARKAVEALKAKLEKEKLQAEIELKLENATDLEKELQKALGLSDEDAASLVGKSASEWISKGFGINNSLSKQQADAYKQLGINGSNNPLESRISEWKKTSETLVTSGKATDEVLKALGSQGDALKEEWIASGKSLEEWDAILGNSKDSISSFNDVIEEWKKSGTAGGMIGGAFMGQLVSSSGDLSNGIEGFANGGIWGAIIEILVGAFTKVASSVEGFEEVMNPVTTAMEELKPFIQWLVEKLSRYTKHLEAMFTVVGELFEALEPLIDIILDSLLEPLNGIISMLGFIGKGLVPVLKAFASALAWALDILSFGLFNAFKDLNDAFSDTRKITKDLNDEKQSELEMLRKTTEAYDKLYSAVKEQEEYYLKKKNELNADTYKEGTIRKVNDMILTDKGVFSTSPKDTIMAMKNPESLIGGANVSVQVIDNVGVNGNIRQEGNNIFIELLSQKIASDYANGNNGWAVAVENQQQSSAGRSVSL